MIYSASEIKNWTIDRETETGWQPCRPENHKLDSIKNRIKWAHGVLTGKYDALNWNENY